MNAKMQLEDAVSLDTNIRSSIYALPEERPGVIFCK